jgi:hypothetical protein
VVKVIRGANGVHNVMQLSVQILLEGDTMGEVYETGDNAKVVATDTCKNTVYVSYPHILISSYPHILIYSYTHPHTHILISSYPHILISSYPHIPILILIHSPAQLLRGARERVLLPGGVRCVNGEALSEHLPGAVQPRGCAGEWI